jgi:hypothetical protein
MNAVFRRLAIAAMGVLAPWPALGADDAISRYDDTVVSAQVMKECHIEIAGRISNDKMRATGEAAFQVLRENLNRQDSSSREQNGELADFLLKKRTEIDLSRGKRLIAEKGCRALKPHARKVLSAYLQS